MFIYAVVLPGQIWRITKGMSGLQPDATHCIAKCPAWEQLNLREWPGKLQGHVRCLLLGKWDRVNNQPVGH